GALLPPGMLPPFQASAGEAEAEVSVDIAGTVPQSPRAKLSVKDGALAGGRLPFPMASLAAQISVEPAQVVIEGVAFRIGRPRAGGEAATGPAVELPRAVITIQPQEIALADTKLTVAGLPVAASVRVTGLPLAPKLD